MSEYKTQDYEQIPYQVAELNKQIISLKAENEELRKSNTSNAKAFLKENKEKHKLLDCLDEIEGICKLSLHCDNCYEILQKIKQAKEN